LDIVSQLLGFQVALAVMDHGRSLAEGQAQFVASLHALAVQIANDLRSTADLG
jgi:hypothetical protein